MQKAGWVSNSFNIGKMQAMCKAASASKRKKKQWKFIIKSMVLVVK